MTPPPASTEQRFGHGPRPGQRQLKQLGRGQRGIDDIVRTVGGPVSLRDGPEPPPHRGSASRAARDARSSRLAVVGGDDDVRAAADLLD